MSTPCPHPEICGVRSHRTPSAIETCKRRVRTSGPVRVGLRDGTFGTAPAQANESLARNLMHGARMGHGSTNGLDEYLLHDPLHDLPSMVEPLDDGIPGYPDAAVRMTIGTGEAVVGVRKDGEFRDFATFVSVDGEPAGDPVETWRPMHGGYYLGLRLSGDLFSRLAYAAHPGRADFEAAEVSAAPAPLSPDARHLAGLLLADSDVDVASDLGESDRGGRRMRAALLVLGQDNFDEFDEAGSEDRDDPDQGNRFAADPLFARAAWIPWARGFEYGN